MRFSFALLALIALVAVPVSMTVAPQEAHAAPILKQKFQQVFFLQHGKTGTGLHESSPHAFTDADLWTIPAGTLIERAYAIVDTAVTGTTDCDLGDDDADGYIDGSLSLTLATPGVYGWNAKVAGAYLRVQTAGATDAADIYVVPNSKFYTVGTKKLKLDCTGTSTAGKMRLVVEGYYLGAF